MTKDEIKYLFDEQLKEINDFEKEMNGVKRKINNIIDNFDLLKSDVTDEEISQVFSKMNIKISDLKSDMSDIASDSKKLQSFLDELKLLKRKREEKLQENEKLKEFERKKKKNECHDELSKIIF